MCLQCTPMSAQNVTRIAGSGTMVHQVLHVEPIRARLRQLRVVVQEPEQDSDEVATSRPETPAIVDTIRAKGTTERACLLKKKKKNVCNFKKKSRETIYLHYGFLLIRKI